MAVECTYGVDDSKFINKPLKISKVQGALSAFVSGGEGIKNYYLFSKC